MSRKSGRIKKPNHLSGDFLYEQTKFNANGEEIIGLSTKELDVSSNISNLINSHNQDSNGGTLNCEQSVEDVTVTPQNSDAPFITCPICDKHLNSDEAMELHLVEHRSETEKEKADRLTCEICGKKLLDLNKYKRHMRVHLGQRPFQCRLCDKAFVDNANLKRHMKSHMDDRPYSCDICHKTFQDTAGVTRHMQTHTERPRLFQCSHCDKNFVDKCGLKRHELTHTGLRPFVCDVCQKSFLDACSFKRHQKIHTGIKNHHCQVCGRSFMEKQSLVRHQRTVCKLNVTEPTNKVVTNQNTRLSGSVSKIAVSNSFQDSSKGRCNASSDKNKNQSLGSLIEKDPELYESINGIVDSIDSYEKMLDLCGEKGQKEIEDALKFKPLNTEDDVKGDNGDALCFECGEGLVNGVNFDSEVVKEGRKDALKCWNCEMKDDGDEKQNETFSVRPDISSDYEDMEVEIAPSSPSYVDNTNNESALDNGKNEFGNHDLNENNSSHMRIKMNESIKTQIDWSKEEPVGDSINSDNGNATLYPCHICSKVFTSSQWLARHIEIHKKDPRECNVCHKMFNSSANLKRHMSVHTGEMKYSCPHCGRQFRDPSNFGKHKVKCKPNPDLLDTSKSKLNSQTNFDSHNCSSDLKKLTPLSDSNLKKQKTCAMSNFSKSNAGMNDEGELPIVFNYDKPVEGKGVVMSVTPLIDEDNRDEIDDGDVNNESKFQVKRTGGVSNSQDKLKSESNIECKLCHKLCENEEHLNKHMKYHEGNPDVTCIECGKSFGEASNMRRHMRLHLDIKPFTCEICGRGYADNWTLRKHKTKGCLRAELKVSPTGLLTCDVCFKFFNDPYDLNEHMKLHNDDTKAKFECEFCGKDFAESHNLKKHRRLHLAVCQACDEEFPDLKSLTDHQNTECKFSNLVKIENGSSNDSGFRCDFCGRLYTSQMYLDRHRKIHFNPDMHTCDICNKSFSKACVLKRHKKMSHSDLKPFSCMDCAKSFSSESLLKRHQISSACALSKVMGGPVDPQTTVCKVCNKSFQKNSMLVRHIAVHFPVRPFTCKLCNKSYKELSGLKRHQDVHKLVKDHVCPTCGRAFYHLGSLKRHMGGKCGQIETTEFVNISHKLSSASSKMMDGKISPFHDNTMISSNETKFEHQLFTVPYFTVRISKDVAIYSSLFYRQILNKKNERSSRWSCKMKDHCWLCDVKVPNSSDLGLHVKRTHFLPRGNTKRFSCRHCFLKFSQKAYWKAHVGKCVNITLNTMLQYQLNGQGIEQETPVVESFDYASPYWVRGEEEAKRPKRSIPQAEWSWLSQV